MFYNGSLLFVISKGWTKVKLVIQRVHMYSFVLAVYPHGDSLCWNLISKWYYCNVNSSKYNSVMLLEMDWIYVLKWFSSKTKCDTEVDSTKSWCQRPNTWFLVWIQINPLIWKIFHFLRAEIHNAHLCVKYMLLS